MRPQPPGFVVHDSVLPADESRSPDTIHADAQVIDTEIRVAFMVSMDGSGRMVRSAAASVGCSVC